MNFAEALRSSGIDARDARILLAAATGFSEASVLAFPEKALAPETEARALDFFSRRRRGEPVAYILGRKEFYGLELAVNPAVLIPRPETELLVELALQRPFSTVLDLGTGSGAIALALKASLPEAVVTGSDVDVAALAVAHANAARLSLDVRVVAVEASAAALVVARRNAIKHALDIEFRHGRWLDAVAGERFELIVSNPPYVPASDPHLADLGYEPREALVAGADGLDAIREIVLAAPAHLDPRGWLLVEHAMGQDGAVREMLSTGGLEDVQSWPDLAGIARVSGGKR